MSSALERDLVRLCELYLVAGKFMEAMVVAKKLVKAEPENANAHFLLARVYLAARKRTRASDSLRQGFVLEPHSVEGRRLAAELEKAPGKPSNVLALVLLVPLLVGAAVLWFHCKR